MGILAPGCALLYHREPSPQDKMVRRGGRTSWMPRPEQALITCCRWSSLSAASLETNASFRFLTTSSIRSSHCSFTSFIWLIHWLLVKANGRCVDVPSTHLLPADPMLTVHCSRRQNSPFPPRMWSERERLGQVSRCKYLMTEETRWQPYFRLVALH